MAASSPDAWSALLLVRHDSLFTLPLPLPPPTQLGHAIHVPVVFRRWKGVNGNAHGVHDHLHLIPHCRLEDFLRWLARNAQYDSMHGLCLQEPKLSPVRSLLPLNEWWVMELQGIRPPPKL